MPAGGQIQDLPVWPDGARAILHVDLDAFYASVEERERPELRGRPVIVGGRPDQRGVVSAASYAARKYGVHSAMPLLQAGRLCPDGVFLPVRPKLYAQVSQEIFRIFERFSPSVEPLSIDEAFLDLTGSERLLGGPVEAAQILRETIRREQGLVASVGVAPNKFVAKVASDLMKPDALLVVPPGRVAAFLAPLPVQRMWGVGPKGAVVLKKHGFETLGDLAAASPAHLTKILGVTADRLVRLARGLDARPVVLERAARSVGHETTFSEDLTDAEALDGILGSLSDRVAARLRDMGLRARTVTLKVRYAPFRTLTRSRTLPAPVCTGAELLATVRELFREKTPGASRPVRLLGVSTSQFSAQGLLFEAGGGNRDLALEEVRDRISERFGAGAVFRGTVLKSDTG